MPNFSSLAGLEVAEKFVRGVVGWWGGGVEHVTTVSNSNASCFRVGLSWVELRWVLTINAFRQSQLPVPRQMFGLLTVVSLFPLFRREEGGGMSNHFYIVPKLQIVPRDMVE